MQTISFMSLDYISTNLAATANNYTHTHSCVRLDKGSNVHRGLWQTFKSW